MVINSIGKTITNKDALILKSKDYEYVWSLKHERNSGIKSLEYPGNYINAVKEALHLNKDIIIDIDEEVELAFKESGIEVIKEV